MRPMSKQERQTKKYGTQKLIVCPHCHERHTIGHFAWSALVCVDCRAAVEKPDWFIHEQMIDSMEELSQLVKSGVDVFWRHNNYLVEYWPKHDALFTVSQSNRYATGTDSSELPHLYYTSEATE